MNDEKTIFTSSPVNTVLLTTDKFLELSADSAMLTVIKKLLSSSRYFSSDDIKRMLGIGGDEDE